MIGDSELRRQPHSVAPIMTAATHSRQIVVWDVPPAIESGETFRVKVGMKCTSGCRPDGWLIEVRDHDGATIAATTPGDEPWAGTAGLYYADVELTAAASPGLYAWAAVAPASVCAGPRAGGHAAAEAHDTNSAGPLAHDADNDGPLAHDTGNGRPLTHDTGNGRPLAHDTGNGGPLAHAAADAHFNLRVVPAPECRLTVVAIEKESQAPVAGARVVVHPYRAVTDARGIAEIGLPKGEYRLFVSGRQYLPFRGDGKVTADMTITAELVPDLEPTDAELWS